MASDCGQTLAFDVAQRRDVSCREETGRLKPVIDRRQTLATEFSVSCRFIPADAAYWIIVLSRWIRSDFPRGRTSAAGSITEFCHCPRPGQGLSVLHKRLRPVLALRVA